MQVQRQTKSIFYDQFYNGESPIQRLPPEGFLYVFSFLSLRGLITCSLTCKTWYVITQENSLWCRIFECNVSQIKEQGRQIKEQYPPDLIKVFGGILPIIRLPVLKLSLQRDADELYMCGTITSDDVSAPIMRGTYKDKNIITFCYSYVKEGQTYSGLGYLFWKNKKVSDWSKREKYPSWPEINDWINESKSNGNIQSIFSTGYENDWNTLTQFITKGTATKDEITFQLINPSNVDKEAEAAFKMRERFNPSTNFELVPY